MTRGHAALGRRRRIEVAVHLVLLVAALFWLPFGTRDAGGVSNVLPALHPLPPVPAPAAERQSAPADPGSPVVVHEAPARPRSVADVAPLVAVLSAGTAAAAAVVLSARPRRAATSGLAAGWHPHAPSRAPPSAL